MAKTKKAKYYVRPDGLHESIRLVDGKRVAFRGKTDREVEKRMLDYDKAQLDKTLFSTVAEAWWKSVEDELEHNTLHGYNAPYNAACAYFGGDYIRDITPQDVQTYLEKMAGKGYARKTITNYLQIVRQILAYAVLQDYIKYNPAEACSAKHGAPRKYRKASTLEEAEIIKAHASEPDALLLVLVYCTGLRRSEAFALRYEDINRDTGMITIRRSMYYMGNHPYEKTPKTEKGCRELPLLKLLADTLPKRKHGYIISPDGGRSMYIKSQADDVIDNARLKYGIESTLHSIRHGYATALHEAGIDEKTAQALLGHAQISTTMDIYTHIRPQTVAAASAKMNEYF